jgi:hypothetical protein
MCTVVPYVKVLSALNVESGSTHMCCVTTVVRARDAQDHRADTTCTGPHAYCGHPGTGGCQSAAATAGARR